MWDKKRERERERERETDRQTDRQRDRGRERERHYSTGLKDAQTHHNIVITQHNS